MGATPAHTFVRQWFTAAREVLRYRDQVNYIAEDWKHSGCRTEEGAKEESFRLSQASIMMEKGGSEELCRILANVYRDKSGGTGLLSVDYFLSDVLDILQDEEGDLSCAKHELPDFETIPYGVADEYDPYFGIFLVAIERLAATVGIEAKAHIEHSDAGYADSCYWRACIRLIEADGGYADLTLFRVSDAFESYEGGARAMAEVYELDPDYDESTQELVEEQNRFGLLESEMLDITDVERTELLVNQIAVSVFAEINGIVGNMVRALDSVAHKIMSGEEGAVEPTLHAAASSWIDYSNAQREALVEDYFNNNG